MRHIVAFEEDAIVAVGGARAFELPWIDGTVLSVADLERAVVMRVSPDGVRWAWEMRTDRAAAIFDVVTSGSEEATIRACGAARDATRIRNLRTGEEYVDAELSSASMGFVMDFDGDGVLHRLHTMPGGGGLGSCIEDAGGLWFATSASRTAGRFYLRGDDVVSLPQITGAHVALIGNVVRRRPHLVLAFQDGDLSAVGGEAMMGNTLAIVRPTLEYLAD